MNIIKKILSIIITVLLLLFPFNLQAANTHSIDLERDFLQYISISDADHTGLDIIGDMTIEAWVKIETAPADPGDQYGIVSKRGTAVGDSSYKFFYYNNGGTLTLYLRTSNGSSWGNAIKNYDLGTGTWVHTAVTLDVSADIAEFFINGSSIGTEANAVTPQNSAATFTVGVGRVANGHYMDGKMDDVRIFDDIRTDPEIADTYNRELTTAEIADANTKGYWKLNNNPNDETANNNDLVETNSPAYTTDVPFEVVAKRTIQTQLE